MKRVLSVIGMALGLVAIVALTLAAFGLPVGSSLGLIAEGAFADKFGLARTAVKATPLVFTGLAMVLAWRAGMYNIGGEGQFIVGGLLGAVVAKLLAQGDCPGGPWLSIPLILTATLVGGAAWAFVAGWLYLRRGVEIVISTILLNFIAAQLLGGLVSGWLQEPKRQLPQTARLPDATMLPRFNRQLDVHLGVIIAITAVGLVWLYLFRTKGGFRLRLVGANPWVARANRIDAPAAQMRAILFSGGLCGLAGGVEYLGLAGQLGAGFAQGWGFLGIPVALLGGLHPVGALLAAVFFGALLAGTQNLAGFTQSGTTLVFAVQAVAVFGFVAIREIMKRRKLVHVEAG